jgi:hypothetical protein
MPDSAQLAWHGNPGPESGAGQGRQVPRAPGPASGVPSYGVASRTPSEGVTPPSSLIRPHAPDHLPPADFRCPSYSGSLQVVVSPCCEMALPGVLSAHLSPPAWTSTPGASPGAFTRFFPADIGLHCLGIGSASHDDPYRDFCTGAYVGAIDHALMVRPADVLATQVAPTAG